MRTDGRPARPGERPRFGSVWTWGDDDRFTYIALGVEGAHLHYLDPAGNVDPHPMLWSAFGNEDAVLPQWRCVEEAT